VTNWLNFSESCERNKHVILTQLQQLCTNVQSAFEIGSYSGQHACHFAQHLPHVKWQCSDQEKYYASLNQNLIMHGNNALPNPLILEVSNKQHWPKNKVELIYTANTLHIMSKFHVSQLFAQLPLISKSETMLVIYGPFNINGQYTSESNAKFERWLKDNDEQSGIRDLEWVNELANNAGFTLIKRVEMPANNFLLVWQFKE